MGWGLHSTNKVTKLVWLDVTPPEVQHQFQLNPYSKNHSKITHFSMLIKFFSTSIKFVSRHIPGNSPNHSKSHQNTHQPTHIITHMTITSLAFSRHFLGIFPIHSRMTLGNTKSNAFHIKIKSKSSQAIVN